MKVLPSTPARRRNAIHDALGYYPGMYIYATHPGGTVYRIVRARVRSGALEVYALSTGEWFMPVSVRDGWTDF